MLLFIAVANSYCMDFVVRKKIALTMSYTILDSLPLPREFTDSVIEREIVKRALCLTSTGPEMQQFWRDTAPLVGVDPKMNAPSENPDERQIIKAEIDVLVARDLFGLTLDEMRYVLDPSDILGDECGFETFGVLKRAEEREHDGKFFTRDLIVSTWKTFQVPSEVANVAVASAASADGR
jgi:hypothetical protein